MRHISHMLMKSKVRSSHLAAALLFLVLFSAIGAERPKPPPIIGRWDLTVRGGSGQYPSWLEVRRSGTRALVGSYVGQFGSARPISNIGFENGHFRFVVPPQWERRTTDVTVEGTIEGDTIRGTITDDEGKTLQWEGRRAPSLARDRAPKWGKKVELFNGRDLTGWKARSSTAKNGWRVRDGLLVNAEPATDLMTEQTFTDFKLHAEFRYPKSSNSGIYLRGRYEVQIEDDYGREPDADSIGGVYGFLIPSVNAARKPGEWQTIDVTLIGRVITVTLNGERIIDRQTIPGITGGALDSDEGKPGPLMVQGDHGVVEFRKLVLTPGE
jgi:hypothetical protein